MSRDVENELIARCRRNDAAAWDELFDSHYDAACRFIFQLHHEFTREDAEEIAQEVFLSVVKNINSFNGQSQFQTWLFRIATNKARDSRDRKHAAKRGGGQATLSLHEQDSETGLAHDAPSQSPAPDTALMNAERASSLREALDVLGEPCREIIDLRYFGDLSYEEIGGALKLNTKTVSSRLSKCLDRLEGIAREIFSRAKPETSRLTLGNNA